ncbi:MAG: hypothetical protein HY062_16710 [Bacteroidetes bacterium]|nr:hypothetical protein [Bacteroidota bacterium]
MKLNFKKIIENRKKVLDQRKLKLENSINLLNLSKPIEFTISEIAPTVDARKKGEKVGINQLNFLESITGPVVYIFEVVDISIKKELLDNLTAFRSKENKDEDGNDARRSTAQLRADAEKNNSTVLYVGSIKQYVHSRVRQHLGFGHKHTFAIQLKHWAPKKLKLRFYYIKVDDRELTYDIEAAVAAQLKPLIGKTEK